MLAHLGAMLAHLGPMWGHLGAMLAHLGAMLARLGAMWVHPGTMLAHSWANYMGPSWRYVGSPIFFSCFYIQYPYLFFPYALPLELAGARGYPIGSRHFLESPFPILWSLYRHDIAITKRFVQS